MMKAFWPVLTVVISLVLFLLPQSAFAQDKTDLSLFLLPAHYPYEVKAGEDNIFYLEVRNYGTTDITDIVFSADKPEGWTIEFSPGQFNSIASGSLQTVDVNIRPPLDATKGKHDITIIATATEMRKVANFELEIKAASYWLWVGIGVAVVVVAGFILVFLRMGWRG